MKLYHYAMLFAVVAFGLFVSAQLRLITKLRQEEIRGTEYSCLAAAVDAVTDAVFTGEDSKVNETGLGLAEEVFFQTLSVLWEGATDKAAQEKQRRKVPCLVIFEERGYYRYGDRTGAGYGWSELVPYENGRIPERFFSETEALLFSYRNPEFATNKRYRMEQAQKGVWEQNLRSPGVFAVYASESLSGDAAFLYAASERGKEAYYVTEDNYCHLPFCRRCQMGTIVARYATQRESAEDGAIPCEECMK